MANKVHVRQRAQGFPGVNQLGPYNIFGAGWEAITASLYDSIAYPAAGADTLSLFTAPIGSGTGLGGAAKTVSDTNMTLQGQLPNGQKFLVQSIEVLFFPTTPTVAADMPASFGAQAVANNLNDTYIFRRTGNLTFFAGAKNYVQDGPMQVFPPKTHYRLDAALADVSTAGANLQSRIAYADAYGKPYTLSPIDALLDSNVNFGVTLAWPEGKQAITNPAWVKVRFDGILYRRTQ